MTDTRFVGGFRQVVCAATLVLFAASATPAGLNAQAYEVRPTVTNALDVLDAPPDSITVGTTVVFLRKESPGARRLVEQGLQVRVFRLDQNQRVPEAVAEKDGCNVYVSLVYKLEPTGGRQLRFQVVDPAWLNLSHSQRTVRNARYLLVVEQAGPTDSRFRLRTRDADDYFATGFTFEVVNNERAPSSPEEVRTGHERARIAVVQPEPGVGGPPCYRYQRLVPSRADDGGTEASLFPCDLPQGVRRIAIAEATWVAATVW